MSITNYSATGNDNHGNACAGIIGAAHNNGQGIAGIAPNCKILPIKVTMTPHYVDVPAWVNAFKYAADNADVISCSCGIPDVNGYESTNPNLHPTIVDAIRYATTHSLRGRGGSVVVFAASNSADHRLGNNGYIPFPANVNISGVLAVGAVDRNGQLANYSPTSIDVVAPSHKAYSSQISTETFDVWSIDIPGIAGYNYVHQTDGGSLPIVGSYLPTYGTNNHDAYTGHFGGTSAAAPQVAGVAALMLSVNPNLTQIQVAQILIRTADNGNYYGGRVNAYKAVSLAGGLPKPVLNKSAYYWIEGNDPVCVWVDSPSTDFDYQWQTNYPEWIDRELYNHPYNTAYNVYPKGSGTPTVWVKVRASIGVGGTLSNYFTSEWSDPVEITCFFDGY